MLEVTEIFTTEAYTICPHCNSENHGWTADPRGSVDTCDSCDKEYKVHPDADIEHR